MSGTRCGVWYRAEGCILPPRHDGPHRNQTQQEMDRLRVEVSVLRSAFEHLERDHGCKAYGRAPVTLRCETGAMSAPRKD